ncbi:hypothetical protein [Streptomyces sp. x-80]|uniref:hypothetical protein n=1 Tax=Streptomyces sp. x-80 TaxID=2789282 RepID=UPI0039808CEB
MTSTPSAHCPAGLDALFAEAAIRERPAAEIIREQRDNVAFNAGDLVAALRDALLDPAAHTPATATVAAHVLLAAHTRELSALAALRADDYRAEHGVTRSTRGLLTGMHSVRRMLDRHATCLDERAQQ